MTKADIVNEISKSTGIDKLDVLKTVESFMEEVRKSLEKGDNVYLRGFGSFIVKKRAEKTARNISQNTTIIIPEHNIPAFKPAKTFVMEVKKSLEKGDNVYLRGFGSFIVKKRAQKTARNISQNTTIIIPEHSIPAFKPAKTFVMNVKK